MGEATNLAQEAGKTIQQQSNLINKSLDLFKDKLPAIIIALIIFILGIIISRIVKAVLNRILFKYKSSIGIVGFLINFIQFLVILIFTMQSLSSLGVNTNSFVAILGAAGFGIGLAFKEVLANFGSCLIILFFKPYQIGDYIKCASVEGEVCEIQIFSTTLKTIDNKLVIMPNSQITTNPLINYTAHAERRIDFIFKFEYDTDISLLYKIANDIFEADERILSEPKPLIGIDSLDNNMIKFVAKPWVKTSEYWDVYFETMEKFKNKFDENNIVIPRINYISGNM